MYVTDAALKPLVERYGTPQTVRFTIPIDDEQFQRIKSSQKNGRCHDFTLYIIKDDRLIVIAKHFYPPGLYRAPSGGIRPGEDILAGIRREAYEETGCEIELQRFLLRAETTFTGAPGVIKWRSLVFQAGYVSGDFQFTDHREIREVRLVSLEEFETFSAIMRRSHNGGLHYRAALHDVVKGLLSFD
jgi:8-oxo-dGTP pyrophosphatase MutT (NUDIX family)